MGAAARDAVFGRMIGRTGIVPNELFIAGGLRAIYLFIERHTVPGRALKAVGAGGLAAAALGVRVAR